MELRHLRYFVAIGEEENYRRAAQRLNVAQTALSTQMQDLEAELGFKLFVRLPRGVKLSAAGKLFLEDARRILQQVNEAAARAARVRAVSQERCVSASPRTPPGMVSSRTRCGSFGNATPTPSYNSTRQAAWIKSKTSGQAAWMPGSCSTCPRMMKNWTTFRLPYSMSNFPCLKVIH